MSELVYYSNPKVSLISTEPNVYGEDGKTIAGSWDGEPDSLYKTFTVSGGSTLPSVVYVSYGLSVDDKDFSNRAQIKPVSGATTFSFNFETIALNSKMDPVKEIQVKKLSNSSLELDWQSAGPTAVGYDIYRNNKKVGSSKTSEFKDTGLNASTKYSYKVIAYDKNGVRTPTTTSSMVLVTIEDLSTVEDKTPPSKPTNLKISEVSENNYRGAKLTWKASIDNNKIKEYRIFQQYGSDIKMVGKVSPNTLTFTIKKLNPNKKYGYVVRAYDQNNNPSLQSEWVYKLPQPKPVVKKRPSAENKIMSRMFVSTVL
jgi:chitodextrinase